jgi:chlorosome envelope protein B
MSNESINDFSVALNNLLKTVGTLAQQQVELLNLGFKAAGQVIEPLVKTSSDLLGNAVKTSSDLVGNAVKISSDLVGNVINTVGQVFQNVTSAIAPKK